jgi:hypothetical protein
MVLFGLATVAIWLRGVYRITFHAPSVNTTSEIAQLTAAIQVFQRGKKVDHLPSRIVLREKMDYDLNDPLEAESLRYLKQVWQQLPQQATGSTFRPGKELDKGIDWNGNGEIDGDGVASPPMILEGDQCLVFFLGGITPPGSETAGFSRDARNPSALPRLSQAFEFHKDRLKDVHGNGFPSFIDVWDEKPYAYFSSLGPGGYLAADCLTITGPDFVPYQSEPGRFHQPKSFQIISAGPNKRFGRGGILKAGSFTGRSEDGDNLANFSNGMLCAFGP